MMREDSKDDPFEFSREAKVTTGQILLINQAMFILGLFCLGISSLAYNMEFYLDFSVKLYV